MTAFGKAKKSNEQYEVSVELSSVNRRYAEISFKMPSGYQELELILRKQILSWIARGQVSVSIDIQTLSIQEYVSAINWPYVDAQISCAKEIAGRLNTEIQEKEIALELWKIFALQQKGGGTISESLVKFVLEVMEEAFLAFDERRKGEGFSLKKDFFGRLQILRATHQKIAEESAFIVDEIRTKLLDRLQKVIVEPLTFDERVLKEVVLLADKADVSEELTRILHHLDHMEKVLNQEESVGKLLEFILQELLREFNTLGSKTTKPSVSTAVILAKLELEKMREQAANVE